MNAGKSWGWTDTGPDPRCVQPRTAMLVLWNNMSEVGAPQLLTLHEGCPVSAGTKYIVTKWFREHFWGGNAGFQMS